MTTLENKKLVWSHHPDAYSVWNSDAQTHKVYYRRGECRIALSGSFADVRDAWADAARRTIGECNVVVAAE